MQNVLLTIVGIVLKVGAITVTPTGSKRCKILVQAGEQKVLADVFLPGAQPAVGQTIEVRAEKIGTALNANETAAYLIADNATMRVLPLGTTERPRTELTCIAYRAKQARVDGGGAKPIRTHSGVGADGKPYTAHYAPVYLLASGGRNDNEPEFVNFDVVVPEGIANLDTGSPIAAFTVFGATVATVVGEARDGRHFANLNVRYGKVGLVPRLGNGHAAEEGAAASASAGSNEDFFPGGNDDLDDNIPF